MKLKGWPFEPIGTKATLLCGNGAGDGNPG
jgi:hypothetical protein